MFELAADHTALLLTSGLFYPRQAASAGALFVLGTLIYGIGYQFGPKGRFIGEALFVSFLLRVLVWSRGRIGVRTDASPAPTLEPQLLPRLDLGSLPPLLRGHGPVERHAPLITWTRRVVIRGLVPHHGVNEPPKQVKVHITRANVRNTISFTSVSNTATSMHAPHPQPGARTSSPLK